MVGDPVYFSNRLEELLTEPEIISKHKTKHRHTWIWDRANGWDVCCACGFTSAEPCLASSLPYHKQRKAKDHRNECLKMLLPDLQQRFAPQISDKTPDAIRLVLRKFPVKRFAAHHVRDALRQLRLHNRYKHIRTLVPMIIGENLPQPLNMEEESAIIKQFTEVSRKFDKIKGNKMRVLNYSFILHRIRRNLGCKHLLGLFKLPRSKSAIANQDDLLCRLRWTTLRSLVSAD
jgi:hypothetical protein